MGFDFSGTVLRAPQLAPSNAPTASEATNGVVRGLQAVPSIYTLHAVAPDFVEVHADQYRASVLHAPGISSIEYLVWAQNSSQLALLDDPTWWNTEGVVSVVPGTLQVTVENLPPIPPGQPIPPNYGFFEDGTTHLVVTDNGNRSLSAILLLVVARGDVVYDDQGWVNPEDTTAGRLGTNPYLVLNLSLTEQDADAGIVRLGPTNAGLLGGGFSLDRGDQIAEVRYTVAPSRFWWTRNDRSTTRFGWNGTTRRWEPWKGSAPTNLGPLLFDTQYRLTPSPKGFPVGTFLPGDAALGDTYAMLRLGANPDSASLPVAGDSSGQSLFTGIRVTSDINVENGYDFTLDPAVTGVVGTSNGILLFNPDYVNLHVGQTLWYVQSTFNPLATGVIGDMLGSVLSPLFVSPPPAPTDYPFIRFGSRRPLNATVFDTEATMFASPLPAAGEVQVASSTGQIRISQADIDLSDPNQPTFSKFYLGEQVYYDGVALNQMPQATRSPVALVNGCIPAAALLPTEFSSDNPYRGLGVSGVLDISDGTGALPAQSGLQASVRPGGDNGGDPSTGRVRQILDGVGDAFLFSRKGAIRTLTIQNYESDLPDFSFSVPQGTAYAALQYDGSNGSKVVLSSVDQITFGSDPVYFLQSTLTPAVYTQIPRLFSVWKDFFRFQGGEILYFAIDGVALQWDAPMGFADGNLHTAQEVATSLQTTIGVHGYALVLQGYLVIGSNSSTGSVEIGWGASNLKDLSGAEALGFLPGWRVVGEVDNWLPNSGIGVGLYRNVTNLDRSAADADYSSRDRVEDLILQSSISANPFVFLDQPPLQDIAGYDDGVFFALLSTVTQGETVQTVHQPLQHYADILHQFGDKKFLWLGSNTISVPVQQPLTMLDLGQSNVIPESMLGAAGIGGALQIAPDGGSYETLQQGTQYLLPANGIQGTAQLVTTYGELFSSGSTGSSLINSPVFTDLNADFTGVAAGYRLKLSSGSYTVVSSGSTTLTVDPPFLSTSLTPIPWEIYVGASKDDPDPMIVADVVYSTFNHLPTEPFQVRLLSALGMVPATPTLQTVSRLVGHLSDALASSRILQIRYALVAATTANTAALVALQQSSLGILANNSLVLPTDTPRFLSGAFSLRIGTAQYTDLVGVTSFSPDPGDGSGIEYLTAPSIDGNLALATGTIKFGTSILADFASSIVWYVEEFQDPSALPPLTVEYEAQTGALNFALADMTSWGGNTAFLVEQMVTEDRTDVALSPISGTFSFRQPLKPGQVVEVLYWVADLTGAKVGNQIQEFLPLYVQNEVAVQQSVYTYWFNPTGVHQIDQRIDPIVYIGPVLQNFGPDADYTVSYPSGGMGQLVFNRAILPQGTPIQVSYAVFDATGGEQVYEASQSPIYRPPFYLNAGISRFGLRGNRTVDLQPGQLLRVGADCFYISAVTYFPPYQEATQPGGVGPISYIPKGDVTAIDIFPPTVGETGSRAPGNDVLTLVTETAITTAIDPDGANIAIPDAPGGLMRVVNTILTPFEPIAQGQTTVTFIGDLSSFAVAGNILEFGGYPLTISQVALSADGTRTTFTLIVSFPVGFQLEDHPTVKISYRPLYPPDVRDFVGVGKVVTEQPFELVLYGETNSASQPLPGRTLFLGVDYDLDPNTGSLQMLPPIQAPLQPGQRLLLSFTQLGTLAPFYQNGVVVYPRYAASYLYNTIPNATNGLLGAQLAASYTFQSPDTFYFRTVPFINFLGEVAQEATQEIASKLPAGGAFKTGAGGTNNWQQGTAGIFAQGRNLTDLDRAARTFFDFYNTAIVDFEQISETISGGFVGDSQGKFRFEIGQGYDFPPPGFEDPITGSLNPRNLWVQVARANNPAFDLFLLPGDPIVDPSTASLSNGVISGGFIGAGDLTGLLVQQTQFVHNDVDDLVLTGLNKTQPILSTSYPYYQMIAGGDFDRLGDPNAFSRIFPRLTKAFFTTYPGIGATAITPGTYNWRKGLSLGAASTYQKPIGKLFNPVIGEIQNISNCVLARRRARARIWGYYPQGLPAGAFTINSMPTAAVTVPCVIATPLLLRDFPIDPQTGYPDATQFLSNAGSLPDVSTGDPLLATPPFMQGDQLAWGQPTGVSYAANNLKNVNQYGQETLTGAFVNQVLYGCVLTFQGDDGTPIVDPTKLLVATGQDTAIPVDVFGLTQGDSIFVVAPVGVSTVPALSSPPTLATLQQAAQSSDGFRMGFDLDVRSDGTVMDLSLPSAADPFFPIKELLGQNSAVPLENLEGPVEFTYSDQNPLLIPALSGGVQDDSGDYQVPYLAASNTELARFAQIGSVLPIPLLAEDADDHYVYPDEILATDGVVVGAITNWAGSLIGGGVYQEPATLLSGQDATPVTHSNPNPGIGDVSPYDLLLIQVDSSGTLPVSSQGFLTVGAVNSKSLGGGQYESFLEPPRFITPTTPPPDNGSGTNETGSLVRYTFNNAIVYTTPGDYPAHPQSTPPPGVYLIEDAGNGKTILDFSDVTLLALNNGAVAGEGNFNDVWSANGADPRFNNIIKIQIFARTDPDVSLGPTLPAPGDVLYTFLIQGTQATGIDPTSATHLATVGGGGVVFGTHTPTLGTVLDNLQIQINAVGIIDFQGATAPNRAAWYLPHTLSGSVKTSIYGYEFSISVETLNASIPVMPGPTVKGGSTTAFIGDDRLSFCEVYDLRHVNLRGTTHPLAPSTNLEGQLTVHEVLTTGSVPSTINRGTNGFDGGGNPYPFSFLQRSIVITQPADYYPNDAGGLWVPAQLTSHPYSPEQGQIKVMGFEGFNNTPVVTASPLTATFSAVPSDLSQVGNGIICQGTGFTEGAMDAQVSTASYFDNRVTQITASQGDVASVVPGDLLVIRQSGDTANWGTTKAGTYLVRHAIEASSAVPTTKYQYMALETPVGSGAGFVPFIFPKVLAFDSGTLKLTATDLAPFVDAPLVGGDPSAFPSSGALYVIRNIPNIASATLSIFQTSVLKATYTGIDVSGTNPVFTGMSGFQYADGTGISAAQFGVLVLDSPAGTYAISGMTSLPVAITGPGLPANNVVGFDDSGLVQTIYSIMGVRWLTLQPPNPLVTSNSLLFDGFQGAGTSALGGMVRTSSDALSGCVTLYEATVNGVVGGNSVFVSDPNAVVYPGVVDRVDINNLTAAQWKTLNIPAASVGQASTVLDCLLPGSVFLLANPAFTPGGGYEGYYAQAGIFLEPSFPHPIFDLASGSHAHEVDQSATPPNHVLPIGEVGMRSFADYVGLGVDSLGDPLVAPTTAESVTFEIRRIRRFHETLDDITAQFLPLRYAYEIRRGRITSYTALSSQAGILVADGFTMTWNADNPSAPRAGDVWNDGQTYQGTNLGLFTDNNVNVQAGDSVRVLDDNGNVLDTVEIVGFPTDAPGTTLKLAPPGLQALAPGDYVGLRFEVYLRQAPVPHEQSAEQLLSLITSKTILHTDANYTTLKGGYCPVIQAGNTYDQTANLLYDDLAADGSPGHDFATLGVQVGDIVIVDPSGTLPNGEKGTFSYGDEGIVNRGGGVYTAGTPDPLDDNRGFYRVLQVVNDDTGPHLVLSNTTTFTGLSSQNVVFPSDISERATWGYTVYPTISNSALNAAPYVSPTPMTHLEGQMDLRPTKLPDSGTHSYVNYGIDAPGEFYSIRPFTYTVIRPSTLFSPKAIDLVLMFRERLLSLMELFKSLMLNSKSGSYFVLQRDHHLDDLGNLTDPNTGLGVISNALIEEVIGRVGVVPFSNTSSCLSVLDRRFWIMDQNLDNLTAQNDFSSRKVVPHVDTPYTAYSDTTGGGGSVRPMLPDYIDLVLNVEDRFRDTRYTWLAYRTHRLLGTLVQIDQFAQQLTQRLDEQQQLLNLEVAVSKAGDP